MCSLYSLAHYFISSFFPQVKSFKGFYWPKARRKNVQKSLIRYFGVQHHQQGRDLEKSSLVHYIVYQRRLLQISSLLMVLYTEISDQTFLYIFSSRFWSIKSFKTLSECESRIVGRSPNFSYKFVYPYPDGTFLRVTICLWHTPLSIYTCKFPRCCFI